MTGQWFKGDNDKKRGNALRRNVSFRMLCDLFYFLMSKIK